jgi:hypothetical protein
MGGSVGCSRPMSWDQARYNLTHNGGDKKTYDSVAQALVPGLKSDSDGIVKIKFGTSFWDYAEAVKCLSDDKSIKNMDTNKLICKINNAQENPFNDVDKIKAGCELDLSKFIHPKSHVKPAKEECSPPEKLPVQCKEPKLPPTCNEPAGGNTFINYNETNNFFFFGGQQSEPCGFGQQPPMEPCGFPPQPVMDYGFQEPCAFPPQPGPSGPAFQQGFNLNITNNMLYIG